MAEVDSSKIKVVTLAGRNYVVKRVPMARVKRLESVLADTVDELRKDIDVKGAIAELTDADKRKTKKPDETNSVNVKNVVGVVVDRFLTFPHAILSIFIDDLPVEIFLDEENGVDLPDFLDALNVALALNRTDVLKNVFSRLMKSMIEARGQTRTISPRTS